MKRWINTMDLTPMSFTCGHCVKVVAAVAGHSTGDTPQRYVYVCPNCSRPTYFAEDETQLPGIAPGVEVEHLPGDVEKLYREARNCVVIGLYTASVLSCRKLLMHIAVAQEVAAGKVSSTTWSTWQKRVTFLQTDEAGWITFGRRGMKQITRSAS